MARKRQTTWHEVTPWHKDCKTYISLLISLVLFCLYTWSGSSSKVTQSSFLLRTVRDTSALTETEESGNTGPLDPLHDSPASQHIWVTPYHPPHSPHQFSQNTRNTQPPPSGRGYEWVAWGKLWQIWLWPDSGFLAPSLLLREEGNESSVVVPSLGLVDCFLRGVVVGEEGNSDVAINACDGLSGVIRLGVEMFFMEPVEYQTPNHHQNSGDFKNGDAANGDHLTKSKYTLFGEPRGRSPPRLHVMRKAGGTSPSEGAREKRQTEHSNHLKELIGADKNREKKDVHICDTRDSSSESSVDPSPSEVSHHSRPKRFLYSKSYTMEVIMVVDAKMVAYHGKHVDQYVLTLMSMVSLIFRDSSLGNLIDIAVVEVVRPQGKTFAAKSNGGKESVSGKSAEDMLKDFCKWQRQGLKQNSDHPRRFDTALLITRENICRNPFTQNCDTLGLAELGTMCSRHASCAIVQDNGLSAAFTIAHELGHLLNMPHDNDDKCKSLKGVDDTLHIKLMSRTLDHNTLPWIWSDCSRHFLTEYLQAGHARCLEDSASTNRLVEDELELTLAGELFNATKQCQYVFGPNTSICPYMPKCKRLWCTTSRHEKEGCKTQHMPWADGTPCGTGMWCLRGECIPTDKAALQKVHGKWGRWQPWTQCSRTCGVGVSRSERHCDAPKPKYGGRYCVGEKVRYKSCIKNACPRGPGTTDFRTQQCQTYNGKNFGLPDIPDDVKWIPKYAGIRYEDSCKLYCQASNSSAYYQLREKVDDGTTCGPDSYDICVNGKCRVAGCDYILNSTTRDDWCGVCGGDNSTCEITTGDLTDGQRWGYNDVVIIPEGAARMEITQRAFHDKSDDDNYLALVDLESGEYLLNGDWIVTPFQKTVEFAGTMIEYSGSNSATERINSTKPLQKKLLVQILSVGKLQAPFIRYSYTKSNLLTAPTFYWRLDEWSNCTEPCAGSRVRSAYCVIASSGLRVADHKCDPRHRLVSLNESCSLTCPVSWRYREWSRCKIGENGVCERQRAVDGCVMSSGNQVDHERCRGDSLPDTHAKCSAEECPVWRYHDWAPCSCPPGATVGMQRRLYSCELRSRPVGKKECKDLSKPNYNKECSCWHAEPWDLRCDVSGKRSASQLELRQLEEVYSITRYTVDSSPSFNTSYTTEDTPVALRSVDGRCGRGLMRRKVVCGAPNQPKHENLCDTATKPHVVAPCNIPCPTTTTTISPYKVEGYQHPDDKFYINKEHLYDRKKGTGGYGFEDNSLVPINKFKPYREDIDNSILGNEYEEETNDLILSRFPNVVDIPQGGWQVGEWGKCSEECGGGFKRRQVMCRTPRDGGRRDCSREQKPIDRMACNEHLCAEWSLGEWSRCRTPPKRSCGKGRRRRLVLCRDMKTSSTLPNESCLAGDRPANVASCRVACRTPSRKPHYRYKWRRGPWSRCSKACDQGVRNRSVSCVDRLLGNEVVQAEYCTRQGLAVPRKSRNCFQKPCPYRWLGGEWSECSTRCNPGKQERTVTCHAVSPLNWVDPEPAPDGCNSNRKPSTSRKCNMGDCSRGFFWSAKPWKQCQAVCGERGRQRRRVLCVDPHGHRVRKNRCLRSARPKIKQRCRSTPCGLTSCKQARDILKLNVDGEYSLLVGGVNVSIYCLGMNVTEPREYLTLPAGEEGNYAEIYSKRLRNPNSCPYDGKREDRCDCLQDESGRAGLTRFSRIRLNITTLSVNMYDYTFAFAMEGHLVAYGEAGDCYSMAQCPQGAFSINLVGTPLKVSDRTKWVGNGNKAANWINRLDDSQRIVGRCGGYCGTCAPDPKVGLKLDIRLPRG